MLNLYQLSIFLTVVEERGFSAAARKRHMTQPNVSQQIRALEHALGVTLLKRNGSRVEPTEAGLALARRAAELLRLADRIEMEMSSWSEQHGGRLALAHGGGCLGTTLPHLLRQFHRRVPEIHVTVQTVPNRAVTDGIRQHLYDAGFIDQLDGSEGLECVPIVRDRLIALTPTRHRLARSETIDLATLIRHPFVMLGPGHGCRAALLRALEALGRRPEEVSVVLEVDSLDSLSAAIEAGVGVGVIPRAAVRTLPVRPRAIPIQPPTPEHVVYWARLPHRLPARAVQRFQDFLFSEETRAYLQPAET